MNVLIVGFGSIGQRHLENVKSIAPQAKVTIWRQQSKSTPPFIDSSVRVVYSLADALETKPDIALLCNPASQHLNTGLILAKKNVHLFIEKPISHSVADVDKLIRLCDERSLCLMVGYNLRFTRSLQVVKDALSTGLIGRLMCIRSEVGQYLPDWRPKQDYRQSVSAHSSRGGGAILELSHELDYTSWLMGEVHSVYSVAGKLSDLDIDVEDSVEIVLEFANGAIGNIHLDMVQRYPCRTCRIIGTEGTLIWDGVAHSVTAFTVMDNEWQDLYTVTESAPNDAYKDELIHFIDAVSQGHRPAITGLDGLRAVELAMAIKQSSQEQRKIIL